MFEPLKLTGSKTAFVATFGSNCNNCHLTLLEGIFFFTVIVYHMTKPKGQLISECLFDFLNFPKNHRKFDKFLPKNMKGVEIIKIKTMPYTTSIYI